MSEQLAATFHEIYRETARACGWSIRPDVDVRYDDLSEPAKELDRALACYTEELLAAKDTEIARLRAQLTEAQLEENCCGIHPEARPILVCEKCWQQVRLEEREDNYETVMREAARIRDLLPDDKPDVVSALVQIAAAIRAVGRMPKPCVDCWCRAALPINRIEVRATEDGLWVHLHGDTKEGAVNLFEVGGPITRVAIREVHAALRARAPQTPDAGAEHPLGGA